MTHTILDAVNLAKWLEEQVRDLGVHVAVGGSCMYRGYSNKDIDILVYPHNKFVGARAEVNQDLFEVHLKGLGFRTRCVATDPGFDNGSSAIPNVWCASYGDQKIAVDFIYLAR